MLNISTEFKQALFEGNRNYLNRAVITLADTNVINVDNEHIMMSGIGIEDAVGSDGSFTALGSAVINSATLTLYNNDESFSDYTFEGAKVVIYTGLELNNGLEELKKGTFVVDTATYGNATITLRLLDNMSKFDKPYTLSSLVYPISMQMIINDACTICGVSLSANSASFPHSSYVVPVAPTSESTTFREVISKCATIAGCFASCNVDGELEFKWFDTLSLINELEDIDGGEFDSASPYETGDSVDGGTFNPWNTGDVADGGSFARTNVHYITELYSQNIAVDDVVITQVKITIQASSDTSSGNINRSYVSGQEGYTLEVKNNEFITEDTVNTVLNWLATQFIGLTFRPCNITHSDNPSIEAGDVALVWDTKGVEHPILITRTNFNPGRPQTIVCGAESPTKNSSTQFSEVSKAYVEVQKQFKDERTNVQQAIDALAERISDSTSGLYKTVVPQSGGGSVIYYHNQPELEDSDIQLLISSVGVTVSADGGTTWYGLTVDGQLISSIMNTIGINFDWGVGGELLIQKNGQETLYVNADSGIVRIVADTFSLANGTTFASTLADAKSYTDNSVGSAVNNLQSQIDGKIETWYQATDPSTAWTTTAVQTSHEGDLWYNTNTDIIWRWDGSAWEEISQSVPQSVFDAIDSKTTIFYGTTSGTYTGVTTGDYLVDSTDGCTYRYDGTNWVRVTDYGSAIDNASVILTENINTVSDNLAETDMLAKNTSGIVNNLISQVDDTSDGLRQINEQSVAQSSIFDRLTVDDDGLNIYGTVPTADNAPVSVQITGNQIRFRQDTNTVAYIGAKANNTDSYTLFIEEAEINRVLRIGKMAFIPRSNGNMCLKYLG